MLPNLTSVGLYHQNIKSGFPLLHSKNPIIEEAVKKAQSYWTKQIVGMQPIEFKMQLSASIPNTTYYKKGGNFLKVFDVFSYKIIMTI